jgi:hypothetical protein
MGDYRLEVENMNSIYYSPQTIQDSLKETAVSDQNNNINFTDANAVKKIKNENFRVSCFIAKNRTKIIANQVEAHEKQKISGNAECLKMQF